MTFFYYTTKNVAPKQHFFIKSVARMQHFCFKVLTVVVIPSIIIISTKSQNSWSQWLWLPKANFLYFS